jgi:hypothetical protein
MSYSIPHDEITSAINNAIEKLELSHIPSLFEFLEEISIMESGGSPRGLPEITHHTNNPFQLMSSAVNATKANADGGVPRYLQSLHEKISQNTSLRQPWIAQSYNEITSNTNMGAICAALYIIRKSQNLSRWTIASSMQARAQQWKDHYNTSADPNGTPELYIRKNTLHVNEAIKVSFPQQKLYEAKELDDALYKPLHQAIVASEFWTYENTYDVDTTDINTILKNDVDQTEAAEVLTSALNNFFTQNDVPTNAAVGSPDPAINPKTIINPGHPNYPNKIVIGGNQGIAARNNKKGSSRFLMNLHLGTFGDNFSISDINPTLLAQNIGKLIRHELIHLYQIESRRKNQRISRLAALRNYTAEKEIPGGNDDRSAYLDSKIEIDAYAHEFAEELLADHGKDQAIAILRGDVKLNDLNQSSQFHEFMADDRPSQMVRRLKRKIYGHIMALADREIYK